MLKTLLLFSYRVLAIAAVLSPIAINYMINHATGLNSPTTGAINEIVVSFIYVPIISLAVCLIAIYADRKIVEYLESIKLKTLTLYGMSNKHHTNQNSVRDIKLFKEFKYFCC